MVIINIKIKWIIVVWVGECRFVQSHCEEVRRSNPKGRVLFVGLLRRNLLAMTVNRWGDKGECSGGRGRPAPTVQGIDQRWIKQRQIGVGAVTLDRPNRSNHFFVNKDNYY